jgi:uncharacterized protein YaiE (UPF0345 family)
VWLKLPGTDFIFFAVSEYSGLPQIGSVAIPLPPMASLPYQFAGVTVVTKANVYFDGKVVSHTVLFADGSKKTLGLIYAGSYHFGTDAAERMEIVAGECKVTLDGQSEVKTYAAGTYFDVAAKSGFTIEVPAGIAEYICSFITA